MSARWWFRSCSDKGYDGRIPGDRYRTDISVPIAETLSIPGTHVTPGTAGTVRTTGGERTDRTIDRPAGSRYDETLTREISSAILSSESSRMPDFSVRSYRSEDLPVLKKIMVEAFDGVSIDQGIEREFGEINGHNWQWRKARHLDEDVRRDPEGIFVVEQDGRILGFLSSWIDPEAGIGHIPNISLVPESRGQGVGRHLIGLAMERFRAAGLTHARIETLVQNDIGDHLYTSCGFKEVARQVHFAAEL